MAGRIIWTKSAQAERKQILAYWIEKNQSKTYSIKLNKLIVQTLKIVFKFPNSGRNTSIEGIKVKIIKDYLLFYEVFNSDIVVLSIFDARRDEKTREFK